MGQESGINSPVEIGSLSHYLQGFMHPKWLALGFLNHQQYLSEFNRDSSLGSSFMFIQNDFETSRVAAVLPVLLANFYQPKLGRSSTRGGAS